MQRRDANHHLKARFSPTAAYTQYTGTTAAPGTAFNSATGTYSAPNITITASAVDAPSFPSNGGAIIGGVMVGVLGILAITSLIVKLMRKYYINQRAQTSNIRAFRTGLSTSYHDRPEPFMVECPRNGRTQTDPTYYNSRTAPVPFCKTGRPSLDFEDRVDTFWMDSAGKPSPHTSRPVKPKSPSKSNEDPTQPVSPGRALGEFPKPPPLSVTPGYLRGPSSLMSYNMSSPSAASFTSGTCEYGHAI
ncbi:hypothetical protein Moror_6696 [Moniliophthora roreri MCA 2997]|uniref:Uncharacterized protein n=1 Tax=Moniliophthora roreri (strain MCA 2997) TaxID=1381753 RepID=V2XV47_MONRO|nr:hypothetical protein Moror_6696 [Moniliophthora roreri MCA 2997]